MMQKFLIVLFATLLYNGVTCVKANVQTSDDNLPEEKPPTVSPVANDHISEKINTSSVSKVVNVVKSVPQSNNASETNSNSTVIPNSAIKNTANENLPPVVDTKNNDKMPVPKHEDVVSKNISHVVENKNMSKGSLNESSSQPIIPNNGVVPNIAPTNKTSFSLPPTPPATKSTNNTSAVPTQGTMKTTIKPDTTTTSAPTSSSTENVMVEHTKPAPSSEEKHFDGPSFIGGIVLTIGLTAIGFIAFKYYKSGKIDRNYRTL